MSSGDVDRALGLDPADMAEALLALPEDQWFDRKSGRTRAKELATTLVALSNAEGGVVVVGLHAGDVDGVAPTRLNELRQASLDFTSPPVRARPRQIDVPRENGTATLLIVEVEAGHQVSTLVDGTCFLRIGDESRKLTVAQQRELNFDRGGAPYDSTAVDVDVAELDQEQLRSYTGAIGARDVAGMLHARDLLDRRGAVTAAACLLFDERPQREFPSAFVRVLRYGDVDRGTGAAMTLEDGHDLRFDGSIPRQILAASRAVEQLMPKWRQLGEDGLFQPTPRIPREVWLEGLVNAVIHRSYSMMGDHVRVEIFPNRAEITSPGRFPGLADPRRPLEITRYARNPRIARVCADLGITRELGEGIKRMFQGMRRRGLVDPIYRQEAGCVRLTLMASDAVPEAVLARLPPSARTILDAMRLHGNPTGTGQIAELAGVTRMTATRALAVLQQEKLVTWQGTSPKDPRATWVLA